MRLDRSFFELQAAFVRRTAEILDISETDAFRRRGGIPFAPTDTTSGHQPLTVVTRQGVEIYD